jgi:predicted DNA-binding transcriptional regulator YafY
MNMFGNKQEKRARLVREIALFHEQDEISIEEMARQIGVDRATIEKDLVSLDAAGVVLHEGRRGRLGLAEWVREKAKRR